MRYDPARGGHAPGHLREMFLTYAESGEVLVEELYDPANAGPDPVRWLLGQLWNCTDTLPHLSCGEIGIEQGSTYAVGARTLMTELNGSTESQ